MRHGLKPAALASEASLFTRLALGATVAIDTLNVIAFQAETTRCHAGNGGQDMQVLAGQLAIMVMIAAFLIWAFPKQEMVVAELEFFQFVEVFTWNTFEVKSIDTLAVLISFHSL